MTDDAKKPQRWWTFLADVRGHFRKGTLKLPRDESIVTDKAQALAPVATRPRRKGLGPKQLKWARKNIANFAQYEAQAIASKGQPQEKKK